ncbi:MAG: hypothetical protein ACOZQL_07565 [Myxococcota bacterium]
MNDPKVINVDFSRLRGKRTGEVDVVDLIDTLRAVVEAQIEPRIAQEVARAIGPLRGEIEKLKNSLQIVSEHVERVRLGSSSDASLVLTDSPDAAIHLATARVSHEERYPHSTVNISERIPGRPSTGRVATVIDALGLKGDPKFWCELKVGATSFNRYSNAALERVVAAFADPQKHLPSDSPALRTVMNFLEGV